MALLTAILAPLILGGMIGAALLYSKYVTPTDVANRLQPLAVVQPDPPALLPPVPGNKVPTP